jgi:hypothetical protein
MICGETKGGVVRSVASRAYTRVGASPPRRRPPQPSCRCLTTKEKSTDASSRDSVPRCLRLSKAPICWLSKALCYVETVEMRSKAPISIKIFNTMPLLTRITYPKENMISW